MVATVTGFSDEVLSEAGERKFRQKLKGQLRNTAILVASSDSDKVEILHVSRASN